MNIELSGTTALVSASTKGIGFAAASGLAAAGARVIVNGRGAPAVDEAVARIRAAGGEAHGIVADLASAAGCEALAAAAGTVDILVHNVAFIGWADIFDADDALWAQAWETNVMAGVRLARHYAPAMAAKGWGRLVFVSSESARNLQPELVPYGATKLALHAVSRGIAKRLAGTGVTANVVLPGPTLSDGVEGFLGPMAAAAGTSLAAAGAAFVCEHRASSLLRRMATVDEVAAMIVYVCSRQAAATSGCVLRVDGGVVDDVN